MIVIKTPQPDTEERLVLVPVRRIVPESRDATPDDLARAGWVPLAAFVGPLDLLTPPTLAGVLEAIEGTREDADRWESERNEAREALAASVARTGCAHPPGCESLRARISEATRRIVEAVGLDGPPNLEGAIAYAMGRLEFERERAEKAESERDGARRDLGKVAMAASAAGWNGSDNPKAVWGFVAHLADERDEALALIEATRQATGTAAKGADMPKAIAEVVANRKAVSELACRLERERDEARDSVDEYRSRADMVPGLAHEVATLRAELARLTAPVEGEPTDEALDAAWETPDGSGGYVGLRALYRLGVAHERARHAPVSSTPVSSDRATDEELVELYVREYDAQGRQTRDPFAKSHKDCRHAAVAAVAAHVRGERCLEESGDLDKEEAQEERDFIKGLRAALGEP